MEKDDYIVGWRIEATLSLREIYNADHRKVFKSSKTILSNNPYDNAKGEACYPGFEFNGYKWTILHNVIVVYKINESDKRVSVEASYSALTGFAQSAFYGEDDPY